MTGDLTIHGVTKPVVLDTHFLGQGVHPFSKKVSAAFRAETVVDRSQFGVTWNAALDTGGPYLGERVYISIVILAARQIERRHSWSAYLGEVWVSERG